MPCLLAAPGILSGPGQNGIAVVSFVARSKATYVVRVRLEAGNQPTVVPRRDTTKPHGERAFAPVDCAAASVPSKIDALMLAIRQKLTIRRRRRLAMLLSPTYAPWGTDTQTGQTGLLWVVRQTGQVRLERLRSGRRGPCDRGARGIARDRELERRAVVGTACRQAPSGSARGDRVARELGPLGRQLDAPRQAAFLARYDLAPDMKGTR
jgi:hypothetical protein